MGGSSVVTKIKGTNTKCADTPKVTMSNFTLVGGCVTIKET